MLTSSLIRSPSNRGLRGTWRSLRRLDLSCCPEMMSASILMATFRRASIPLEMDKLLVIFADCLQVNGCILPLYLVSDPQTVAICGDFTLSRFLQLSFHHVEVAFEHVNIEVDERHCQIALQNFLFCCAHYKIIAVISPQARGEFAPVIHPKMNSGKESFANAEFGMRSAECATSPSRLRLCPVRF